MSTLVTTAIKHNASSSNNVILTSGGDVTVSGTLTTTSLVETSSITLKENIEPISDALQRILLLEGVTYRRKDGSADNEAGLIAEEVAKVLPNLVVVDEHGNPTSIMYTKLTVYLIEAVKRLTAEITELKSKL